MRSLWRRITPDSPKLTNVLKEYCRKATVDPDTVKRNRRVFRLFITETGNCRAHEVTKLHAAGFQASLRAAGKSKATCNSYCAAASSVFGWAKAVDLIAANPFLGVKKIKRDHVDPGTFSPEEMGRLLHAIDYTCWREPVQRLQWRAMLLVLNACGLRIGEVLNLRWDDIDLEGMRLAIRYRPHIPGECWEWGTKGHRDRLVPVTDDLAALLCRMREACPWRYPFLLRRRCALLQRRSGQLTDNMRKRPYSNLYKYWQRLKRQAKVESDGAFHCIRRTAATELAEYLTTSQLKTMFGWQNLSTAEHYVSCRHEAQLSAVTRAQTQRAEEGTRTLTPLTSTEF